MSDRTRLWKPAVKLILLIGLLLASPCQCPGGQVAADPSQPLLKLSFDSETTPQDQVAVLLDGSELIPGPTSKLGSALRFEESTRLKVGELGTHSTLTIGLWLRVREAKQSISALYATDAWQAGSVHFNYWSDGSLQLAINGSEPYLRTPPAVIPPRRWVYCVAIYDTGERRAEIYVNGQLVTESILSSSQTVKLEPAHIGLWNRGDGERSLNGDMDEFTIEASRVSQQEIRRRYLRGKGVPPEPVDYARQVLPILRRHCYDCHGPDLAESGLRLDVRDGASRGGESGEPAVLPFAAEQSELVRLIRTADDKHRMPLEAPRLSDQQIQTLTTWIDQGAPWPDELAGQLPSDKVESTHWAFQPIQDPAPPRSNDEHVSTGHPIDAFIFARLQQRGLRPSRPAPRSTLIRRIRMDTHGLPPSLEQLARWSNPQVEWSEVVDEVLASPRFAERWASHWLDVIRYGETHGFEVNTPRPNAWPYRDYVIKSFHEDKPYDQFLREQLVGDQLGTDAATGFLVAAPALLPGQVGKDEASKRQARSDELHEVVNSVGGALLGLTIGCARCHNHKFDPIRQSDYYALVAVFAGLRYGERPSRNPEVFQLRTDSPQAASVFAGQFITPETTFRLYRGDPMQRRERMAPNVPAVLGDLQLESNATDAERRIALASWLTSPKHPLTARVIVNRIWQHHFGNGLVETPSDFGSMGAEPTHPELLDWLASRLIENQWSLKSIHRLILTSNTYRQSSRPMAAGLKEDSATSLLWRFPPRRLDMEPIRDSVLFVSGALDLTMGGPGFSLFKPNTNYVRVYEPRTDWGEDAWRRMVYAHRVRMEIPGVFGVFDCPDAGQPTPKRSRSTTALQSLSLMNSSFMIEQSEQLALRVAKSAEQPAAQIECLYRLALGRSPSASELNRCLEVAHAHGLSTVCRVLLNCNEFLFIP